MRLWTVQIENTYHKLEKQEIVSFSKPDGIDPVIYDLFIKTTKFHHWPVWCWLHVPQPLELQKYCNRIYKNEQQKAYLLKLNVPNNEKMIFIPETAWKSVVNNNNNNNLDMLNHLFDFKLYQMQESNKKICVCINCLNPYWIEKSYMLNDILLDTKYLQD